MESRLGLLTTVELRKPRGNQPAGAIGAVVELFATEALVEITDEHGKTLEVLNVGRRIAPPRGEATQICIIGCVARPGTLRPRRPTPLDNSLVRKNPLVATA
jgi:hypothetical protein